MQRNLCGYWEWDDDELPDRAYILIKQLKTKLEVAEKNNEKLTKKLEFEVMKSKKLQETNVTMKKVIMILWALIVGVVIARMWLISEDCTDFHGFFVEMNIEKYGMECVC